MFKNKKKLKQINNIINNIVKHKILKSQILFGNNIAINVFSEYPDQNDICELLNHVEYSFTVLENIAADYSRQIKENHNIIRQVLNIQKHEPYDFCYYAEKIEKLFNSNNDGNREMNDENRDE